MSVKYLGKLNSANNTLVGKLNIYTMETGDGRDIELSVVDDYLCWRRVHDVDWNKLFSIKELQQSNLHTEIATIYAGDTYVTISLPVGASILSMVATEKFTGDSLLIDWRLDESTGTLTASISSPYDKDILLKVTYFDETS